MRIAAFILFAATLAAQKHDIGFTLGRVRADNRPLIRIGPGNAWQANYGYRLNSSESRVGVYATGHFLAAPFRQTGSGELRATRDIASLYLTPALRVKFAPGGPVSPWIEGGGGLAVYEHSLTTIGRFANPAPRLSNTGALVVGAGADFRIRRWFALRGEIRDFYSGSPVYNIPSAMRRQHNLVVGGGFALRFR
ncbi:MAG: porin family protein [Acidobacteria bacterium]|nr:porin family protein [Acidobacteriota bacterium]